MTEGPRDPAVDLAAYLETRLNLLNESMKALNHEVEVRLNERELRYEQRFEAQKEAILKSEAAVDKRLESMNEFRKTLGDQASMLMPRTEATAMFSSLTEKINRLEKGADIREGATVGSREQSDDTREQDQDRRSNIGMWIAFASVIIGAVALIIKFSK